jgi:two-component system LytT family response regulator
MLSAIIIDDEELARNLIIHYLNDNQNIRVVGQCSDGFEALKAINHLKPDIIFLDIQMPKLNGFELLEVVEHQPCVIFSTAFDAYALKAFEQNATDYLLKPYSQSRFDEALKRAEAKLQNAHLIASETEKLLKNIDSQENIIQRVVIKHNNQIEVIPTDQLIYIESADDYVMLHTSKGRFLKQKTMKYFEDHLDKETFVRIHRSYLVQISYISRFELYTKDTFIVYLKNNVQLPMSRAGSRLLKEKLGF